MESSTANAKPPSQRNRIPGMLLILVTALAVSGVARYWLNARSLLDDNSM